MNQAGPGVIQSRLAANGRQPQTFGPEALLLLNAAVLIDIEVTAGLSVLPRPDSI
jgi:hypothetical protein